MIGPIFYDQRQSVDGLATYSPSAGKPARFNTMVERFHPTVPRPPVYPVAREDLYQVHDKTYVDGVFAGSINNGFENNDRRVPEACLWTIGSLVSAALHAPTQPLAVCSPTSGFHHAGYALGGGFCTFNGLLVAAAMFIETHPDTKVGILDCDVHYGDGTDDILKRKPTLARQVVHHTSGRHFHGRDDPDEFFLWLEEAIADINARNCDLVLYQAGADMHIKDPLGGFLDDAQMRQRDRTVFRKLQGGLVWNLAGGYQPNRGGSLSTDPVLEIHLATMEEANASGEVRLKMHEHRSNQKGRYK